VLTGRAQDGVFPQLFARAAGVTALPTEQKRYLSDLIPAPKSIDARCVGRARGRKIGWGTLG
jgi:hypothetical protein